MEQLAIATIVASVAYIVSTGIGVFRRSVRIAGLSLALALIVLAIDVWRTALGHISGWYVVLWAGITGLSVVTLVLRRRGAARLGGAS
jgi:hypothetical protein